MRKINHIVLELVLPFCAVLAYGQNVPNVNQSATKSICSNIVVLAGSGNVNCSALTPEQQRILKSIPVLLKTILDKQPDLVGLKREMDQVYALVQSNSAVPSEGASIAIDHNSDDNFISGARAINVPLTVKVDNQSNRNTIKDSESIKDCFVPDVPHRIAKYNNVSNESLRESVIQFSKQLREFASSEEQEEENQRSERRDQIRATVDFHNITQQQMRKLGEEGRKIDQKDEAQLAALIGEKFLGQATEYREELRWRLQSASLLPQESLTEMVRTFWPDPTGNPELDTLTVKQTATYLENLARQLP